VRAVLIMLVLAGSSSAQTKPEPKPPAEPFAITDNSFLVEEAFNQEPGIFQNIGNTVFVNGNWAAAFTQEWPLGTQAHQFSFTLPYLDNGAGSGVGDTFINYRYQAFLEGPGRPAFSPRLSLIIPTGKVPRQIGSGTAGLQVNLPFSKQTGDWFWHWNGGLTWLPRADSLAPDPTAGDQSVNLLSPFFAGSGIYRVRQMFNLMLESVLAFEELADEGTSTRETIFTISPGARGGWNLGDQQLVLGAAMPIVWVGGDAEVGLLLYFSYELPFKK
jgi:hypothetical protein